MILSNIIKSSILQPLISIEDGNHLHYWMGKDKKQKSLEMIVNFTNSIHQRFFPKDSQYQIQLEELMAFNHLAFLMEMVGGAFNLQKSDPNILNQKDKVTKNAAQIYMYIAENIFLFMKKGQIDIKQEEIQQLLRRIMSHLSQAFEFLASYEKPYILKEILLFFHQIVINCYQYLSIKSFEHLITLLIGITQQIIQDTGPQSKPQQWTMNLKCQITQTLFLSFIYSGCQNNKLWEAFSYYIKQWTNEEIIDKIILSRWRSVLMSVTENLVDILYSPKKFRSVNQVRIYFLTQQDFQKKFANQADNDSLKSISPFVQVQNNSGGKKKKSTFEETSSIIIISIQKQHALYLWYKFLHLLEGCNNFYQFNNSNFQQDHQILTHFIKTIKMVVNLFLRNSSLRVQKSLASFKEKKEQQQIHQSKSLNIYDLENDLKEIPFKGFYENTNEFEQVFKPLGSHQQVISGTVLLKIFGKFLYPNCEFSKVKLYQKVSIKSLRSLANIFTQSQGPFESTALKRFIKLLIESQNNENYLKVIKIVTKGQIFIITQQVLKSFLEYQGILLHTTASTLIDEYRAICKKQLSESNTESRKQFNIILVEFLNVYAGRGSELFFPQLENLYHITIESFKIERCSYELFYKMSMTLLHYVKVGRMEQQAKAIMEISLSAARKDQEYVIKYLRTSVDFIFFCVVMVQAKIQQCLDYNRGDCYELLVLLLSKVAEFNEIITAHLQAYDKSKKEKREQLQIESESFYVGLIQTLYQLSVINPKVLSEVQIYTIIHKEKQSLQLIDTIINSLGPYSETKIKLLSSHMFRMFNNYVGNIKIGEKQFFFNTEVKNSTLESVSNSNDSESFYIAINREVIIEARLYDQNCNYPSCLIIIRNSFGLNIWEATQLFYFISKEQQQPDSVASGSAKVTVESISPPSAISKSSFTQEVYNLEGSDLVDQEIINAIQEDLQQLDEKQGFQQVQQSSAPQNSSQLQYLVISLLNQLGVFNNYPSDVTLQVLKSGQQLQKDLSRLDQVHFRNTIIVNCFYIHGLNTSEFCQPDPASRDFQIYRQFMNSLGVHLTDETLNLSKYSHIQSLKEQFLGNEQFPRFWENEWVYCSTIMQEMIFVLNGVSPKEVKWIESDPALKHSRQYYNGFTVLYVIVSQKELQDPRAPLALQQFQEIMRSKSIQYLLIIYAVEAESNHSSGFRSIQSLQMKNGRQFESNIRGPLLNYMSLHEDELKLFLIAQVANTYRMQNYHQNDQIRKRERYIYLYK